MSPGMVVGVITIVAVGAVLTLFGRKADLRRAGRFSDRPELSLQELEEQFYAGSGIPVSLLSEALQAVEQATGVPRGRLRPQDRFAEELAPEKGWEFDDGLAELRWTLEALGVSRTSAVLTVDDFIRAFAAAKM